MSALAKLLLPSACRQHEKFDDGRSCRGWRHSHKMEWAGRDAASWRQAARKKKACGKDVKFEGNMQHGAAGPGNTKATRKPRPK